MLKYIKRLIKNIFYRPIGMARLGNGSLVTRPFILGNRSCMEIGHNVFIHKNSEIMALENGDGIRIVIGDNVYIGKNFHAHTKSKLMIGDNSVMSDDVYLAGASHGFDPEGGHIMNQALSFADILIGKNVFIGRNVFLSQGVRLGDFCIVGANSVVTKSFESYLMIAGSPAKPIKRYSKSMKQWVKI